MVKVRKIEIPSYQMDRKCPYYMDPIGITVHNTANDAPAINEILYMQRNTDWTSFHFAVDDVEAIQGLPLDRNSWNAGDGNGLGNRQTISIEICYSLSGGERYRKAENNAIDLIVRLYKHYGFTVDDIYKHQDWNGKWCPHRILSEGRWDSFIKRIKEKLEETKKPYLVPGYSHEVYIPSKHGIYIREGASDKTAKIGILPHGATRTLAMVDGVWGKLKYQKGWIALPFTKKCMTYKVVSKSNLWARKVKGKSDPKDKILKPNDRVIAIGEDEFWIKDKEGYYVAKQWLDKAGER